MIKDALKQIFTYGLGNVAHSALSFLLLPLYLRYFEPAEYGIVSLLLVVISLLNLFANAGVVSGLFMLYYESEEESRKSLAFTTFTWYLLGAGVSGGALIIAAPYLSETLFHAGDYSQAVRLVGAYFFVYMMIQIPLVVFRLEKKARHYVVFSLLAFLIDVGLKILFIASLGRGINGYFESGVIANFSVLVLVTPFILRYLKFSFNAGSFNRLLHLGFPFVFSTVAVWTLGTSDRLILNYFKGTADVGIYSLANNFALIFNVLLTAPFGLFWTPFFLSYASKLPSDDIKALFERVIRYVFLAGCILVLGISLGSGDVLRIFTDLFAAKEGYLDAGILVPLLTTGILFHFMHGLFAGPLFVVKKPRIVAVAGVIAAASNLGLNFLLIPRLGALGAALTTLFAYALFMVMTYIWAQRLYPVNYVWWRLALVFTLMSAGLWLGWLVNIANPWLSLFTRVITGIGVFLLSAWFLSGILSREERHHILGYLRRKLKRTAT